MAIPASTSFTALPGVGVAVLKKNPKSPARAWVTLVRLVPQTWATLVRSAPTITVGIEHSVTSTFLTRTVASMAVTAAEVRAFNLRLSKFCRDNLLPLPVQEGRNLLMLT